MSEAKPALVRRPFDTARQQARRTAVEEISEALRGVDAWLSGPMRYATDGGKALRAFFVQETSRLHGIAPYQSAGAAAGIEALHAYSLIHDDLPCMDDDDMRRGRPTVHKKYGEARAVLAGDALQSLAFELVCGVEAPAQARLELVTSLAVAAGVSGMVGGQAMDIMAESAETPLTLDQITTLQAGKTGALITWACLVGPRMVGADIAPLRTFGDALGLAFQVADDILDVEGDAATVGKATQKDAEAGKATFVSCLGLDGAKGRAEELVQEAQDALSIYGEDADTLREAARFVIARKH